MNEKIKNLVVEIIAEINRLHQVMIHDYNKVKNDPNVEVRIIIEHYCAKRVALKWVLKKLEEINDE